MLKVTRQEQLLRMLQESKALNLVEISKQYDVSTSTIRRDLFELSQHYPITFTHGGAIYTNQTNPANKDDKSIDSILSKIGKKALELIDEGDTIIIDSGLTTFELARAISNSNIRNLTIITTNIAVADIIDTPGPNISVVVVGGEYRGYYHSLVGSIAEETISKIKVKKAFIGTTGISENGFYTSLLSEMDLRKRICSSAQEVILLANESKFGIESGFLVSSLNALNKVVTNSISDHWIQVMKKANIETVLI